MRRPEVHTGVSADESQLDGSLSAFGAGRATQKQNMKHARSKAGTPWAAQVQMLNPVQRSARDSEATSAASASAAVFDGCASEYRRRMTNGASCWAEPIKREPCTKPVPAVPAKELLPQTSERSALSGIRQVGFSAGDSRPDALRARLGRPTVLCSTAQRDAVLIDTGSCRTARC